MSKLANLGGANQGENFNAEHSSSDDDNEDGGTSLAELRRKKSIEKNSGLMQSMDRMSERSSKRRIRKASQEHIPNAATLEEAMAAADSDGSDDLAEEMDRVSQRQSSRRIRKASVEEMPGDDELDAMLGIGEGSEPVPASRSTSLWRMASKELVAGSPAKPRSATLPGLLTLPDVDGVESRSGAVASPPATSTPDQSNDRASDRRSLKETLSMKIGATPTPAPEKKRSRRRLASVHLSRANLDSNLTASQDKKGALGGAGERGSEAARWILHPEHELRMRWDVFNVIFLIYCSFSIPLRVAFGTEPDGWTWVLERTIDVFFILDVVLNFRTGIHVQSAHAHEEPVVEMRAVPIAQSYLKGWFWVDFVSATPIHLIELESASGVVSGGANRLPRMLKLIRLLRMLRILKLMKYKGFLSGKLEEMQINPVIPKASRLLTMTMVTSHILACLWFFVHTFAVNESTWWHVYACSGADSWSTSNTTRLAEQISACEAPACSGTNLANCVSHQYVVSLYWAVTTLTTVGYGDISPVTQIEILYSIFVMFLGVAFYAYVAANVSTLLSTFDQAQVIRRNQNDRLTEFLRRNPMSNELSGKLRQYFKRKWRQNVEIVARNERKLVEEIAVPSLKIEVLQALHAEVIASVHFFFAKDPLFVVEICPKLTFTKLDEGEYILREGEPARELFFLQSGSVEVDYDDIVIARLRPNREKSKGIEDYFGDIALSGFVSNHLTSFRCASEVHLYTAKVKEIEAVLERYPDVAKRMVRLAVKRITQLRKQIKQAEAMQDELHGADGGVVIGSGMSLDASLGSPGSGMSLDASLGSPGGSGKSLDASLGSPGGDLSHEERLPKPSKRELRRNPHNVDASSPSGMSPGALSPSSSAASSAGFAGGTPPLAGARPQLEVEVASLRGDIAALTRAVRAIATSLEK